MGESLSEHDSTVQFDMGLERADSILGAAKDIGIATESGQNMCSAAKDIYNIEIERKVTAGDIETAAGLANLVTQRFKEIGDEDISDFFETKTGILYGKVEDIYDAQITEYKKAGRPDMAAQIAHNAAKVFIKGNLSETAKRFEELAKSYLEMVETFYREDTKP